MIPDIDMQAMMDCIRQRCPDATVRGEIFNPDYRSWRVEIRHGERFIELFWGPLSGFGGTDHDNVSDESTFFDPYDRSLDSMEAALGFVVRALESTPKSVSKSSGSEVTGITGRIRNFFGLD
jgi:hypothetical protein